MLRKRERRNYCPCGWKRNSLSWTCVVLAVARDVKMKNPLAPSLGGAKANPQVGSGDVEIRLG